MQYKYLRKIAFSLMGIILLVLISATFVEKLAGTDVAVRYFYTAPWTIVLWLVTVCCGVAYLCQERRSKHINRWTFLFHFAFPIILLGAFLTHTMGREGTVHLRLGEPVSVFETSDGTIDELPFRVTLEDFRVVYYPGTRTPEDFVSSLVVSELTTDRSELENSTWDALKQAFKGQSTTELPDMTVSEFLAQTEQVLASETVSMNHVARFRGWRFCQASYDDDFQGVTLLASFDPVGTAVTYLGYAWFLLFFLLYLLLGNRAKPHHHHHHHSSHKASSEGRLVGFLLLAFPLSALAGPRALQRPVADTFGDLYVEYNGRVCPMSSLASDVCLKLFGRNGYVSSDGEKYTANQVLSGLVFYYEDWANIPLKQSRKPRANSERELVRQMVANGSLLKIWPSETGEWFDVNNALSSIPFVPSSQSLPCGEVGGVSSADDGGALFRQHVLQYVAHDLAQGHNISANETLQKLRIYQQQQAPELPSERRFRAEQLFRRISYTKPMALLTLLVGFVLFLLQLIVHARGKHLPAWLMPALAAFVLLDWLFLTAMLGLRWYVSGHVPMASGHETMQLLAWLAMLFSLLWAFKDRHILPSGCLVAAMALMVSMMTASNPQIAHLMPVLQSPLLSLHVSVIMFSYALLAFVMCNGIAVLFLSPEAQRRARHQSDKMLRWAVGLLAVGIFLGSVWANVSWGRYWAWDPKEVWALITLLVYAAPLHRRSLSWFQNTKFYHAYAIGAFLSVLITYFGVNFFLGGLHAYM